MPPSTRPAPTSMCNSSIKTMMRPAAAWISASTAFSRSSNSPRNLAPARISVRSSASTRRSFSPSGTSPAASRCARPSTTAVFPTPGSPISTGIVLGAPRQHLDRAADLVVAADDRVELALAGLLGQVAGVFLQRLPVLLGRRRIGLAALAHFFDRFAEPLGIDPGAREQAAQRTLRRDARQQALGGDKTVAGGARRLARALQDGGEFRRHIDRVRPAIRRRAGAFGRRSSRSSAPLFSRSGSPPASRTRRLTRPSGSSSSAFSRCSGSRD